MQSQQDIEEFETHKAKTIHKEPEIPYRSILEACKIQSDVLLHGALQQSVSKLLNIMRHQEIVDKSQKANIFPIILKENQQRQLPLYLEKLLVKLDKNQMEDGFDQKGIQKFKNIFELKSEQIMVKEIKGTDVRDVILDIYTDSEDIPDKPNFKLYVYVITEVTDLSEENRYIFSKGISNKKFIAFLPTYSDFDDENYQATNNLNYQKFSLKMYDEKLLFAKYIYNCIKHPDIKAYMPPQIFSLVTDMDYYSLSYFQSCRRFDYCLLKVLRMNPKERLEIKCEQAILKIETLMKKKFSGIYQTDWLNILKVILTEQQTYKISYKELSTKMSLDQMIYNSQVFLKIVIESFKKHLPPDLLEIFQKDDEEIQKKSNPMGRKIRQRIQQLQIDTNIKKTPKMILENKITRIIKTLTKNVRDYAKNVKWSSVKFIERFKPCIPLKIVKALIKQSQKDEFEELIEQITSSHQNTLSNLLSIFDENSRGKGLYLIKNLELSGLITLSKKQINPIVYNNFFEKAKFN